MLWYEPRHVGDRNSRINYYSRGVYPRSYNRRRDKHSVRKEEKLSQTEEDKERTSIETTPESTEHKTAS